MSSVQLYKHNKITQTLLHKVGFSSTTKKFVLPSFFYHGPDVSRAMVMWPPCCKVRYHLKLQTRSNMSQSGRRPGTAVGDEWHVVQALWSRN